MAKPDIIVVDGHAFSWQRLIELRRQQLEAWKVERSRQLTLFELKMITARRRSEQPPDITGKSSFSP